MRIALHATGAAGEKAGKMLLAEPGLARLGLWHTGVPAPGADPRVSRAEHLGDFDVLASDDVEHPARAVKAALEAGISCVLIDDGPRTRRAAARHAGDFAQTGATLLLGANHGSGIGPALAAHESALVEEVLEVMVAWTVPGKPRRRGEAVPFPGPVGSRWARTDPGAPWPDGPVSTIRLAAPLEGPWAAATARVAGIADEGVITRIVGVADDAVHLEALALTAGAVTVALHAYPSGPCWVSQAPEAFLDAALRAGLEVAAYTLRSPAERHQG